MKILAALAAFAGLCTLSQANAQSSNNCSALTGTPLMCMENHSSYPIVAVQASSVVSFNGTWIPIPGGMIPPNGMSIVRFPTWGNDCTKSVVVKTASNATHVFPGVNVCSATKFVIAGW